MGPKVISFDLEGEFAAFRDPSVTTNQLVYFIPSKSAVIGLIGAIVGISRSNSLSGNYDDKYIDMFKNTKIGIKVKTVSNKITFFTNHRSLKESITKPYKSELLEKPRYTIFVQTNDDYAEKIVYALKTNEFVYSPYLGHMYCPAILTYNDVSDASMVNIDHIDELLVPSVVLDESETYNKSFKMHYDPIEVEDDISKIIVERHLHHFMNDGKLDARVLKHFIPIGNAKLEIFSFDNGPKLLEFIHVKNTDENICVY